MNFDLEQPLWSGFLYRIVYKETSKEISQYIDTWKDKAKEIFTIWIENEKANGSINKDVSTEIAVQFLLSMSSAIRELIQSKYSEAIESNLSQDRPLLLEHADDTEEM